MVLSIAGNLPVDKIILGYAGNLEVTGDADSYGIEDIIRALALLPDNFLFLGIGKKTAKDIRAERLAEELQVADKLHGRRDHRTA